MAGLGVEYGAGDKVCPSREAAKEAAVAWWEKCTAVASKQHQRGRSRDLAAEVAHCETCQWRGGEQAGSQTEHQGSESNSDTTPASQRRTI